MGPLWKRSRQPGGYIYRPFTHFLREGAPAAGCRTALGALMDASGAKDVIQKTGTVHARMLAMSPLTSARLLSKLAKSFRVGPSVGVCPRMVRAA
jgi:hypothetical protein